MGLLEIECSLQQKRILQIHQELTYLRWHPFLTHGVVLHLNNQLVNYSTFCKLVFKMCIVGHLEIKPYFSEASYY